MSVMEAPALMARPRISDLVELTKPRITLMILFTVLLGFYLGTQGALTLVLLPALLGTALITSGTAGLNQYMERDLDARMRRTESRPLPSGRVRPGTALFFCLFLCVAGFLILATLVNLLTGLLAAATTLSYLLLYTPLKRVTSLATVVGAIPGALPPLGGWTAATGRIDPEGLVLFALLFLWQLPHFLAIAWLYREDYGRAGMPMLSLDDAAGRTTAHQVLLYTLALLSVSLLPTVMGFAGPVYFVGALGLGLALLTLGASFARRPAAVPARRLVLAWVLYLPLVGALLMLDRVGP